MLTLLRKLPLLIFKVFFPVSSAYRQKNIIQLCKKKIYRQKKDNFVFDSTFLFDDSLPQISSVIIDVKFLFTGISSYFLSLRKSLIRQK